MDVAPSADTTTAAPTAAPLVVEPDTDATAAPAARDTLVEEELLVEEVSIDGMCGVY
jgi:mycofactocin precursor